MLEKERIYYAKTRNGVFGGLYIDIYIYRHIESFVYAASTANDLKRNITEVTLQYDNKEARQMDMTIFNKITEENEKLYRE